MTTNYKDTLNLPRTDFVMKADLARREPLMLAKWQADNIYQQVRDAAKGKPKFVLHDGPPYANGPIHLGTALNKTLKDIIVKAKTLSGFDAALIPGWDCHGLPIELHIEKTLGKPGAKITTSDFRKACRDFAASQIAVQSAAFQRLGIIADWAQPYLTMDFKIEAGILRAFATILAQGNVEPGYRPVHWCLDCHSALAEAEVEYYDKASTALDVMFSVSDLADLVTRLRAHSDIALSINSAAIPIWTTTAWTLPANEAVAVHSELTYVLIRFSNDYLIIAESLLSATMARYHCTDYQVLVKFPGQILEQLKLVHPLSAKLVPVILSPHVTETAGTGAVHIAPAHGYEDFMAAKDYNLPLLSPLGSDGYFAADCGLVGGLAVHEASAVIITALQAQHKLLCTAELKHSYPHCWRHRTPVIFRATPQWFINLDTNQLRDRAVAAVAQVSWVPEWGEARLASMISQRKDWCVSRQRLWGVPIALFLHKVTGAMHPRTVALLAEVAQRIEVAGIEAWYQLDPHELLGADADDYQQCYDILDVWFDSGVTHATVLAQHPDLSMPADLYLEGSDQHRGWFNSALLTAVAIRQAPPYKAVLTHGYVIDLEGRKMSKSLGNVLDPNDIMHTLGADVLRLWVASVDYRAEIYASAEIFAQLSEIYRRLRNTARFLLANIYDFVPAEHMVANTSMLALDRWVVAQAKLVQDDIIAAYDEYKFHVVYHKLHNFCVNDLGGFYLDIIKDRQYTNPANSVARRSAQTAMYHIIAAMVRWFAPVLSFTAEEIWQHIPGQEHDSVFLAAWYQGLVPLAEDDSMNYQYWAVVRQVRDAVNKVLEIYRNQGLFKSLLSVSITIYGDDKLQALLQALGQELRFVLLTADAKVLSSAVKPAQAVPLDLDNKDAWLTFTVLSAPKCNRCWHLSPSVGANKEYADICERCVTNLHAAPEARAYA